MIDSFTLLAPRRGTFTVRLHFTPLEAFQSGQGSVRTAPGGWTDVDARRAGVMRVAIEEPALVCLCSRLFAD